MKRFLTASLAVVFFCIIFLAPTPLDNSANREFWSRLFDAGHFAFFAFLVILLHQHQEIVRIRLLHFSLAIVALAAAIEIIQPLSGRSASIIDFIYSLLGASCGLAGLWLLKSPRRNVALLSIYCFLSTGLIAAVLFPAFHQWQGIAWRSGNFPLLADFESEHELVIWTRPKTDWGSKTKLTAVTLDNSGPNCLKVKSPAGYRIGLVYAAGDQDWSDFKWLRMRIHNPSSSFITHIRIDDSGDCRDYYSRFNTIFYLQSGWNIVEIPLTEVREMPTDDPLDLENIRRMILFTTERREQEFCLDWVRLA